MAQINEAPPELPVTVSEPVRNLVFACIAKNPADRPASAAHLARAAQALRRGDVAGRRRVRARHPRRRRAPPTRRPCSCRPPAPAPTAGHDRPAARGSARRRRPPSTTRPHRPDDHEEAQPVDMAAHRPHRPARPRARSARSSRSSRSRRATRPADARPPEPRRLRQTPSPTPTPTPTPTSTTVPINEADFDGLTRATRPRAKLQGLGMVAERADRQRRHQRPAQVDTVYSVNPTGPVPKGSDDHGQGLRAGDRRSRRPPTRSRPTRRRRSRSTRPGDARSRSPSARRTCPAGQTLVGRRLYVNGQAQTPVNATLDDAGPPTPPAPTS